MRLKIFLSFFIPFFLFCQSPQDSSNNQAPQDSINDKLLASDKQRSWCIDQFDQWKRYQPNIRVLDDDQKKWFQEFNSDTVTASKIFKNDYPDAEENIYDIDATINGLYSNNYAYLRYCKILADINDI